MFYLRPHGTIDLEHRAWLIQGTPSGSVLVAGRDDCRLTIIGPDFQSTECIEFPSAIGAISLHPTKPLLAWVDKKSGLLKVQKLDGVPVAEITPPRLLPGTSKWIQSAFADCHFDANGNFVWLVAPLGDRRTAVQLRRTEDWSVAASVAIKTRHEWDSSSFHDSGIPNSLCVWVNDGLEQELYWLRQLGDRFTCERAAPLKNTTPPAFSPDGRHFVVLDVQSRARCYESATMRETGSGIESGFDDDPFAESQCYLDDAHVLIGTNDCRVLVIDVHEMKIDEEIAVAGHEPRSIGDYYPRLAADSGLCTDLDWFTRVGDVIVFIHHRDDGDDSKLWKDSLLWYRVPTPASRSNKTSG